METAIKLDLQKYLKILRHLELLPRPLGQDWSEIWLQRFSGTITIWPKSILSDFFNILSDPSPVRLKRMIRVGERSCWPKIRFISNRMKVERVIIEGLRRAGSDKPNEPIPSYVHEQQNGETLAPGIDERDDGHRSRSRGTGSDDDSSEPRSFSLGRRQSTMLEELGRQASVLWNDDVPTEGEEGAATTTDTDEEEDVLTDEKRFMH